MTDYSDEQIARDDLGTSSDFEGVIRMQSGEIRNAATRAYVREYNHEIDSNPHNYGQGGASTRQALRIEEGDAAWKQVWKDFEWIVDLFELLAKIPDPSGSMELAASMTAVAGTSTPDAGSSDELDIDEVSAAGGTLASRALEDNGNIAGAVRDWQGAAANNFRNDFLRDIPHVIKTTTALGHVLASTARANAGLLLAARKDAQNLGRVAKETLDAYEPGGSGDGAEIGFKILGVVGVLGGAVVTLAGGPAGAGATFAVLSGISSVAGLAESEEKEKTSLSADTVEGITDKIFEAVDTVLTGIRDSEDVLVNEVLNRNYQLVMQRQKEFLISRPTLVDLPISDFRPPEV